MAAIRAWHDGHVELAREWLKELSWRNMEEEDFDDLTAQEIRNAVNRYYDGGEVRFVIDAVDLTAPFEHLAVG
jgi:hypothetical protein